MRRSMKSAIITVLMFAVVHAEAWERDVHYDLTRWLAQQRGLSTVCADTIARADQSLDDRYDAAAIPQMVWVHLSRDVYAAVGVQLNHFPGRVPPPSRPSHRKVKKDSVFARGAVKAALDSKTMNGRVLRFGRALHPFQDSWSHAGVSSVPLIPIGFPLNPDLSFAHPWSRGGWMSHDADLAWLHVKEVVEVARRTYEYMGQLRVRHPGCATSKEAVPFENLTKAIEDYAACTTKDCKRNWLIEHQQGAELAQTLTVSGRGAGQLNVRIGRSYPDAPAGTALVADAQRFVDAWLARKNPLAAAEQIDLDSLRSQFAGAEGVLGSESHDGNNARREWTQRFLTMYLADDHAAVNEYGHGNPAAHRYSELPLQPQTDGRFQSWEKINVPQIEPEDFLAIDDGSYVLVLLFDQMPHDSALLTWKEREGKWKVSGLLGFVD